METLTYKKENKGEEKIGNRSKPTLDKNGELAIAYNIAYNRISIFIENLTSGHTELRDWFQKYHDENKLSDAISQMRKISLFDNETEFTEKSYTVYVELMYFLFKEKAKTINTEIIDRYIPIINLCLLKLWRLRDYHSHYYHSDFGLFFSNNQQWTFKEIFNVADNQVRSNYNKNTFELYDKLFDSFKFFEKKGDQFKIKGEGINIFLSLFLTKREMSRFLSDRQYCSQTNPLEYKVKREVYTFYCHKDSANVMRKALEKGEGFDNNELLQAREASLQNYINTMPYFMYDDLNEEEKEKHFRRKNRFMEHALDYFADVAKLPEVEWRTNDYILKLHKEIPENSSKVKPILKRKYLFKAQKEVGDKWKIKEKQVELRLNLKDGLKAQIRIGQRFITHWLALHFFKHIGSDKIVIRIKEYATAYYHLIKKKNTIDENDKLLLEKIHGQNFVNNRKLQKLLKTNSETGDNYKDEVEKRIRARIDYFTEMKKSYGAEKTKLHSLQQVKSDEQDEALLKKFKDAKKYRYLKNNLIKKAIKLLGRLNLERKNVQELDRYHYLFDVKPSFHSNIIKAFSDKLPDEVRTLYRQVNSFDDLFIKMIDLVIEELNKPLKRWERIEEKGIHYWASKLKVKWYHNDKNRFDRIEKSRFDKTKKSRTEILLENCITEEDENGQITEVVLMALPDKFFELSDRFENSRLHEILPYQKVNTIIKNDQSYHPAYFGGANLFTLFDKLRNELKADKGNAELKMKFGLLNRLRIWKREDAIIEKIKQACITEAAMVQLTKFKYLPLEKTYNLQMDVEGIYVKLKHNDIFSTRFFSACKKFNKLAAYQINNNIWQKGTNKTIEEMFDALHQIYFESRSFISALLGKEKTIENTLAQQIRGKEKFQDLPYLVFDEVMNKLNINEPNIKNARNNALHADFSGKRLQYKSFEVLKSDLNL